MKKIILSITCLLFFIISAFQIVSEKQKYTDGDAKSLQTPVREKLSDYALFEGKLADLTPAKNVLPYQLNTPLFSDYAEKLRFVYIPEGTAAHFHSEDVFEFPVGTILIKNFYYYHDARSKKERRILETRLLLHQEEGWEAYPYIWNDEQTEAYLDVAGDTKEVVWKDEKGKKQELSYSIPNVNQCKSCHLREGKMTPIGPVARQLNSEITYTDGKSNQLEKWERAGKLKNLLPLAQITAFPIWSEASSGTVERRARAWLDVNCAFCHNPKGAASTSGLFLEHHQSNLTSLGIYKTPVAAGRGSGNFQFDIVPAKPEESILVHRIASTDPAIMMPELGRKTVHKEGLETVKAWIRSITKP